MTMVASKIRKVLGGTPKFKLAKLTNNRYAVFAVGEDALRQPEHDTFQAAFSAYHARVMTDYLGADYMRRRSAGVKS